MLVTLNECDMRAQPKIDVLVRRLKKELLKAFDFRVFATSYKYEIRGLLFLMP